MNETRPDACPILGIESSCDETAAALLDGTGQILAEAVFTQSAEHARFGGVVPEIAARAHLQRLASMVQGVLAQAGLTPRDLGAVAATSGPGLIGGLIVGASLGKGLALGAGIPFLGVNHLEAHALTARMPGLFETPPEYPFLLILVSGGHCQCVAVEGLGRYRRLGTTLDDAVGEAFDKAAKLLGLPWPGGAHLERLAAGGDAGAVPLPRPLLRRPGCDFSFSGLKTAVARWVEARERSGEPVPVNDVAASFQEAVCDVLVRKALDAAASEGIEDLLIGGGVAANSRLRHLAEERAAKLGIRVRVPRPGLCTDNGAMVAALGAEMVARGRTPSPLDLPADSSLPVTEVLAG